VVGDFCEGGLVVVYDVDFVVGGWCDDDVWVYWVDELVVGVERVFVCDVV